MTEKTKLIYLGEGEGAASILPCPFCGGAAERWYRSGVEYVGCRAERCIKPKAGSTDVMTAIARWNQRAERAENGDGNGASRRDAETQRKAK